MYASLLPLFLYSLLFAPSLLLGSKKSHNRRLKMEIEMTNELIKLYLGVGIIIIITCIIGWFVMMYFVADNYSKTKEIDEKEKELKKIRNDNYIIDSITCEVREIVREELDKK